MPSSPLTESMFTDSTPVASQGGSPVAAAPITESMFLSSKNTLNQLANPQDAGMSITQQLKSYSQSLATGGFHGIDRFATTLMKLGAKTGIGPSAEAIQATYDDNSATYAESMKRNPTATGIGDIAGTTLATMPAMALPGVAGAGIGSVGAVGRLGLSGANMAAQGAAMGGLSTAPGQDPNTVINVPGAITGGQIGGLFGTTVSPLLSAYGSRTAQLAKSQEDLAAVGYTGKQFATDLPSNSWIDTVKSWSERNILQKLPGIMGTSGARATQGEQINKAVSGYINTLSQDTSKIGPQALGNVLNKHYTQLDKQEDALWTNFASLVPDHPVKTEAVNPIMDNIKKLILDNKQVDTGLATKEINLLKSIADYNTPAELNTLKKQVWDVYSGLQTKINKGSDNPVIAELADNTRQLYWAALDDMKTGLRSLQGDSSAALQAFNEANAFTSNFRQLMDPKARPQLVAAIKDSSDQMGKVSDFMRWLNSPTTSAGEVYQSSRLLGKTGQAAASGYGLQQLYQTSMQSSNGKMSFNLGTFLDGLNKLENSPQSALYQPALDAMSGLRRLATEYAGAVNAGGKATSMLDQVGTTVATGGLGAGVYAAGANPLATAGVLMTPTVMSFLAANSPLKNTLITLAKLPAMATAQAPSSLIQYLSTKGTDLLTRGGLQITNDEAGNTVIDKAPEKAVIRPTSLNEYTPLRQPKAPASVPAPSKPYNPFPPAGDTFA